MDASLDVGGGLAALGMAVMAWRLLQQGGAASVVPGSRTLRTTTPPVAADASAPLEWREGRSSALGHRVLWVRPASRALRSEISNPEEAAFFAAGCPVDVDELLTQLPQDPVAIPVNWPVGEDEGIQLFVGFRPLVREDKWRIVAWPSETGLRLFFLRSWTGVLSYVVSVDAKAVRSVWASRSDRLAAPTVRALIDGYLLGKPCVVPAPPELGTDRAKLLAHGLSVAGRACDAVLPTAASVPPASR